MDRFTFYLAGFWPDTTSTAASPGGVISGVVLDDTGAPIAGALVLYKSVPPMIRATNGQRVINGPLVASGVKTGVDGTFQVGGLSPATYNLCAYGIKPTHLGTCEWGQGTVAVNLASGETIQLTFRIATGSLLTFQVNDPNQRIRDLADFPTSNGRLPLSGANFGIGVWVGPRYAKAMLVSNTAGTRQYQLAVPKTVSARLFLDTSLRVANPSGVPIAVGQPSITLAPAGQTEIITSLTIP